LTIYGYKNKIVKFVQTTSLKEHDIFIPNSLPLEDDFDVTKLSSFELQGGQIELIIKNKAYKIATFNQNKFKKLILL